MIIAQNNSEKEQVKRTVSTLADNLNKHLAVYAQTGLPEINGGTLKDFAADPVRFFNKQCTDLAKEKGMEGASPVEFSKLFNISFAPNLQRYPINPTYLDYMRLEKNKAVIVSDIDERLSKVGVVEISDPEQIEAAKLILDTFKKFTYIATLLSGNQLVQTAGTERIGFSLMNMGSITPDTVSQLAAKMADVPMDQWEQQLFDQFKIPSFIVNEPVTADK